MAAAKNIEDILSSGLMAIIRSTQQTDLCSLVDAIVAGGIKVIEITSTTPGCYAAVKAILSESADVLIGVGTIVDQDIAVKAIDQGAQFLVTPNTNIEIIKVAKSRGVPVLIGALTPTEIQLAYEHGADAIKLFPASALGVGYMKAVTAPLANVNIMPVGGIDLTNMADWIKAGATAFGIGSALVNDRIIQEQAYDQLSRTAAEFVQAYKDAVQARR